MSDSECLTYLLTTQESEYTEQICWLGEATDTIPMSPVPQLSWIDWWSTVDSFGDPHPPMINLIPKSIICWYRWTWQGYTEPFLIKAYLKLRQELLK